MNILGINYLSESSICLVNNRKLKFAVSEERLNRIKNWYGNPYNSIDHCLKENKLNLSKIDIISTHGTSSYSTKEASPHKEYLVAIKEINRSSLSKKNKSFLYNYLSYKKKDLWIPLI